METKNSALDAERETHYQEWVKARDLLQFFDGQLHDLRKFGFSFVTALMTADGLLLSSSLSVNTPGLIKFGVFVVTALLILAIHLLDKNYLVLQEAADLRAVVLERNLNIELSSAITDRYHQNNINLFVMWIYIIFELSVVLLGIISMGKQYIYIGPFIIILGIIFVVMMNSQLKVVFIKRLHKQSQDFVSVSADWTITPLEFSRQGFVRITLNNFNEPTTGEHVIDLLREMEGFASSMNLRDREAYLEKIAKGIKIPKPISFAKGDLIWELVPEGVGDPYKKKAEKDLNIYTSYTWVVKGSQLKSPGPYQLRPGDSLLPLHRNIILLES
jgi:hypothetical protein